MSTRPTPSSGPALAKPLPDIPDIKVETCIDYGLTDIVAGHYDAGVRLGEQVANDMIVVRIGPDTLPGRIRGHRKSITSQLAMVIMAQSNLRDDSPVFQKIIERRHTVQPAAA